ncbi:nucleosidase [Nocardioides sp. BP30]|uniref:nucleosidase n=1 Tax=Nocardioides sp. BP30 TaxID=3036374 RepID=UPI002468EF4D|nr:nucleosidase [Nocardioides sp. BP30]WGL50838.1 nucleosidase [Nocardioides sp. BP30]
MKTLVVSATKAEAAHVPAHLPVLVTGVGKVAAASAVASELARAEADGSAYDLVVNIGSAGALHDHLEGLHEIGSVLNHDLSADVLRGFGYDPQEWLEVGPAEGLRLATGDVFVSDPVVRGVLAERADLVDMEGYAVAWACRQAGVPVRLVKHISDKADEGAMDWLTLVDLSARALGDWLRISLPRR